MKPIKSHGLKSSEPSFKAKAATKREKKPSHEPPPELDRRGKQLPPRQRVGGIITPQ
ncbi:MAG: hypothetical protein ACJ71S_03655 [Acidobacteriaceae bacterium]